MCLVKGSAAACSAPTAQSVGEAEPAARIKLYQTSAVQQSITLTDSALHSTPKEGITISQ